MLGLTFLTLQAIEQGSEVFDLASQSEDAHLFLLQGALQILQLAHDLAQFALHRKRAFGALFAAGNGQVVEAFSGVR